MTTPNPNEVDWTCPGCNRLFAIRVGMKPTLCPDCQKSAAKVSVKLPPAPIKKTLKPSTATTAAPAPVDAWYMSCNGSRSGPYPLQILQQQALSGDLLPTDLVWQSGNPDWQPASTVVDLLFPVADPLFDPSALPPSPSSSSVSASKPATASPVRRTGRILFWGGVLLLLLATMATITVDTEGGRFNFGGRVHNMPRAAQQLVLMLCGMASMLSGAMFLAQDGELSQMEQTALVGWLIWIACIIAAPIVLPPSASIQEWMN